MRSKRCAVQNQGITLIDILSWLCGIQTLFTGVCVFLSYHASYQLGCYVPPELFVSLFPKPHNDRG